MRFSILLALTHPPQKGVGFIALIGQVELDGLITNLAQAQFGRSRVHGRLLVGDTYCKMSTKHKKVSSRLDRRIWREQTKLL